MFQPPGDVGAGGGQTCELLPPILLVFMLFPARCTQLSLYPSKKIRDFRFRADPLQCCHRRPQRYAEICLIIVPF